MKKLIVFYDNHCDLCRRSRRWVETQPVYLPIRFQPLHSTKTRRAFPDLERFSPEKDLVVFTDEGAVYQGTNAWIMVLWALKDWREWSFRLSRPGWRPLARRFWNWISTHRIRRLPGAMDDDVIRVLDDEATGCDPGEPAGRVAFQRAKARTLGANPEPHGKTNP